MERRVHLETSREGLRFLNALVPTLDGLMSLTVHEGSALISHDAELSGTVDALISSLGHGHCPATLEQDKRRNTSHPDGKLLKGMTVCTDKED